MKKKWGKGLSMFLAGVLVCGSVTTPIEASNQLDKMTEISDVEVKQLLESSEKAIVRKRDSIHDPSITVDEDGNYYVFGSHMGVSKTNDLKKWMNVTNESTTSMLFGDEFGNQVSYQDAFKEDGQWIQPHTVQGNMWAPDIIYNETMKKWSMYLSLNGPKWNSTIVLLTADQIEGPYVYQGPVVYSGFSLADSSQSFHDTDLEMVLGKLEELPAKYQQISNEANGNWGDWWPHAIDPAVFYDEDGKLWMAYGSWSGGICMLELDENTGLRDYSVTYSSDYDTKKQSYTSDAYFGTRIAGGYYVSGEGAYIEHIGDYYYLFVSYGGYAPNGGYNMRIFRSNRPDGEYVDSKGVSAIFDKYVHNFSKSDIRGENIMAGYKWNSMKEAEVAQGHNSAFVDKDEKAYVVYHTKFADGSASHELRVHQLFINEDDWLLAAPYEYSGEALKNSGYSINEVVGEYDVIVHEYGQNYSDLEYATPQYMVLQEDGKISGAFAGTWKADESGPQIHLTIDNHTYKGVLVEQNVDGEAYQTLCFTAVNENGLNIWGSKLEDDKREIAKNVKNFEFGVPLRAYESFALPTVGNGGVSITWVSSNPEVLTADGQLTTVTEKTQVTLTAILSKGDYYYSYDFPVVVLPGDGTFTERTLIDSFFVDNPQDLSDKSDGSLSVPNPFNKNITKGLDISGGVSVEFDVERRGPVNVLGTILGFTGGGKLYFTPGSYLGYNATGGFYDANLKSYELVNDYIGDNTHVSLFFLPEGFEVKVDGDTVYNQDILATEKGAGDLVHYRDVLKWLNNTSDTLNFGFGSWWPQNANCIIQNVECYVEQSPQSEWLSYEKEEVILTSNSDITYIDNPFLSKNVTTLELEYNITFNEGAAKNGWDGIFSFFNSETKGRVSMQTNPYLCYNASGNNKWVDINNLNAEGSTNWAATAEIGKEYHIKVSVTQEDVKMYVDEQELTVSVTKGVGSYSDILSFIGTCDWLTLGVGNGETSYWATEICTLRNLSIRGQYDGKPIEPEAPGVITLEDGSKQITKASGIEYHDNPLYGQNLEKVRVSYDIVFAEDAIKSGWDGIFSFFNKETAERISFQSNPYVCYNNMGIENHYWIDVNKPDLVGSTNWAVTALKGQKYHIDIVIDEENLTISVDDVELSLAQAQSENVDGYKEMLESISNSPDFTIGVGTKVSSFWSSELCTLSNIELVAIEKEEEKPGEDVSGGDVSGGDVSGGDVSGGNNKPKPGENIDVTEILKDICETIKNITSNSSVDEKVEALKPILETVWTRDWKKWNTEAEQDWNYLNQIEEGITNLLGTETKISRGKGVPELQVRNALLSADAGKDAVIKADKVNPAQLLASLGNKYKGTTAYEFQLFNGDIKSQLKVPVKVRFQLPSEVDTSKKIYVLHFLDETGQYEVIAPTIDHGYIEFITSSFSTFALVNENDEASSNDSTNNNSNNTGNNSNDGGSATETATPIKSPKTYDIAYDIENVKLLIVLSILALASIGLWHGLKKE